MNQHGALNLSVSRNAVSNDLFKGIRMKDFSGTLEERRLALGLGIQVEGRAPDKSQLLQKLKILGLKGKESWQIWKPELEVFSGGSILCAAF